MENFRICPVCHAGPEKAKLFIENNVDPSKLTKYSFASRKTPEFMCYRLVQCINCDLVYADQPPGEDELSLAYHVADYDSSEEADDAAAAYIKAIHPILSKLERRQSALEIGTGTGIFLEYLLNEGFKEVIGIEPSSAAIEAAPEYRRAWIQEGIFEEKNFAPNSFDLICCFMTMEHVHDPRVIANAAFRLLRPGGAFVTITHDYRSFCNSLLGKRSPIIDIEHMQLFSKRSANLLYKNSGYAEFTIKAFVNTYSIQYWLRLAPVPYSLKSALLSLMQFLRLGNLKLGVNVGNMIATGFKRA
jgi:SAM-dependent methyltransferase